MSVPFFTWLFKIENCKIGLKVDIKMAGNDFLVSLLLVELLGFKVFLFPGQLFGHCVAHIGLKTEFQLLCTKFPK